MMGRVYPIMTALRAYSVPLVLFATAVFFQLGVIPKMFPLSHYDGIPWSAKTSKTGQEGTAKTSMTGRPEKRMGLGGSWGSSWFFASPPWDSPKNVFEEAKSKYSGKQYDAVHLPLLDAADNSGTSDYAIQANASPDFLKYEISAARLILVYSSQSKCCSNLSAVWSRIVAHFDGIASTAAVELGNVHLAAYLAEKKISG